MQNDADLNLRRYPAVRMLMRWGRWINLGVAAAPLLVACLAVAAGAAWWWVIAAAAMCPVLYLFLCSYLELIRIIDDTLLPR